jgi:hypothetical protein
MLRDSWKLPVLEAPSPKKHSTTLSLCSELLHQGRPNGHGDIAAHDAGGAQVAVITSAMCMEPPLPLQSNRPSFASTSAIILL